MANRKPKTVSFRRKREQKTNYTKRLYLLMSRQARLVVRLTNTKVIAQLVTSTSSGDSVVVAVDSGRLVKLGWNYSGKNIPAAYLTGLLLAKLALKKGVKEGILDTGFRYPHPAGKIYAVLKGVVDGGVKVPHSADVFPHAERLQGGHVAQYATSLSSKKEVFARRFAQYLKSNAQPAQITSSFDQVKKKIMSS